MRVFAKSPEATFDYSVSWPRGALLGVPIAESEWRSRPEGLRIEPLDTEPGRTAARIAGGVPGGRYRLVHRVTLADDRTLTRILDIEATR
jgi:hypothetical protein